MEGVPRISMMSFPLRKSADAPSFKTKLKTYIRDEYKEDPESYNQEIHDIEALRAAAVHISKDFSGCSTLKKYFCQLNYLKTRFHMTEGAPCSISFSWRDAFSETVHGWSDIEFEMSCILYNVGALHSELGTSDNRQSADGMKNACTHFQCAAWAFQHMRNNYQSFFTQDISPDCLSIMTNICLAQAQECILEKSLIDNRKSTITAKVALQIVEYYQLALKTSDQMIKDSAQYSDKVIKAVKTWKKLIELKSHYYSCISFLYRGMQAEDESKYGERVTFYKAALEKLNDALKSAKSLEKTDNVHDTLQFTFDVVQGKVANSEKENEFVYHEKVPELSAINGEIKAVSLVKGIPFKFDDPQIAGPDIFLKLVPIEAHEVSSLYSEEKAKVLRHFATKIEKKNEALDKIVIALQLDHLDFDTSVKKVPQELVDCCAALSVNKDAVKKLSESMGRLSGMFRDVEDNLGEIEGLIQMEEKKEKEYEHIMGTKRKQSNVIMELSREFQKYKSAHSVAAETNQTLHDALRKHVGNLQVLMKPFDDVVKYIPAMEAEDEADTLAITQMKKLVGKVDEMKKQRIALEEQLRESIHNDDITEKIVVKVDSDLTDLFCQEIMKHEKHTKILEQNLLAQDNIIRALTEANAAYAETRKKTASVLKRREKVIEDLISSFESYDELLAKCNKGIEFYTKLDTNVQKLLQRVNSVCKVQEEERETSMQDLINKSKAMNLNPQMMIPSNIGSSIQNNFSTPSTSGYPSSGGHLKLKDVLAMKKQQPQIPQQVPVPEQNPSHPNNYAMPTSQGAYFPQNQQQTFLPQQQSQNQPQVPVNTISSNNTVPTQNYFPPMVTPNQQPQSFPQQQQQQVPANFSVPSSNQNYYSPAPPLQNQSYPQHSQTNSTPQNYFVPPQSQNQKFPQHQPQTQTQQAYINAQPAPVPNQNYFQHPAQNQSFPQQGNTNGYNPVINQNPFPTAAPQSKPQNYPEQSNSNPPNQNYCPPSWPINNYNTASNYPAPQQHQQPPQNIPQNQMYQPSPQNIPQQQQQPPPTEYNPSESYLAKYVKQHMGTGSKPSTSGTIPTSFPVSQMQTFPSNQSQAAAGVYQQQQLPQNQYGYTGQGQASYSPYQNQQPPVNTNGTNIQNPGYQNQTTYQPIAYPNQQVVPPNHYGQQPQPQQQQQYHQPQNQQPKLSSNIDLLSDLDLSTPQIQPLTPNVTPSSNQDD